MAGTKDVPKACFKTGNNAEEKEWEDIRKVARAYFDKGTSEAKKLAEDFFKELDGNGDGEISPPEFKSVVASSGGRTTVLFKKLDKNGDKKLDFDEVLVYYYMDKTGVPGCNACEEILLGPYFSCATCLGKDIESYNLCCNCYSKEECSHEHPLDNFIDTGAQLKMFRDLMKNAQITTGFKTDNIDENVDERNKTNYTDEDGEFKTVNEDVDDGLSMMSDFNMDNTIGDNPMPATTVPRGNTGNRRMPPGSKREKAVKALEAIKRGVHFGQIAITNGSDVTETSCHIM